MNNRTAIERFWQTYLATLPPEAEPTPPPPLWEFGDSSRLADELAALIMAGVKTATCSALWEYETDGETLPQPGQLGILQDGAGRLLAVVQTVEVEIKSYDQVDAAFAFEEGEDDRSLASWRNGHRRYFTRTLARIGREFDESMPLICERFRVLYRRPAEPGTPSSPP